MKKFLFLLVSCILCSIGFAQVNVIETELQEVMDQKGDEMIDVTIIFKSQMDAVKLQSKAERSGDKALKREIVISELKDFSLRQQSDVMAVLHAEQASGNVADIESLWIVNSISCKATRDVIYKLSQHPDVAKLSYDKEIKLISDEQMAETMDVEARRGPAAHTVTIRANRVWSEYGYTGKNVVVAVLDTGVNYEHKDIKDNLWEGDVDGETVNGWNVIANNSNIVDDNGHGTHCAGIVCGDGTSGTTTGIAPDALLMTVKTLAATGTGSVDNMIAGVQFAIEHGADILSISYGFKSYQISVAQKELIRDAFDAVLTSGAIVCAAAGNDGNNYGAPNNVDYPAACPSPWKNADQTLTGGLSSVIAVGANDLATSSQGPSTWQDTEFNDYQYSKWTHYCGYTGTYNDVNNVFNKNNQTYSWAVKYTPNMVGCFSALSKVSIFGSTNDITVAINIYNGGDDAPSGNAIYTQSNVNVSAWSWNDINLTNKVNIDPTKNLWIVFSSNSTTSPAAYGQFGNTSNARLVSFDNGVTWEDNGVGMWLVRGFVEDIDGNTSAMGLIRPDISAPGDLIYSLNHTQNNAYKLMSGSSQSTPAVAGVMALMLEKNSSLTSAQITEIIETTAADKPTSKNNKLGAGRVDAFNAVANTTEGKKAPYLRLVSFSPKNVAPGNNVEIKFSLKNEGKGSSSNDAQVLVSLNNDQYVNMDNKLIEVGSLDNEEIKEFSFTLNVGEQVADGHVINFNLNINDGDYTWKDNFSVKVTALPNIVYKSSTPSIIRPEDGNVSLVVTMVNNGMAPSLNETKITLSAISNSLEHITIEDNEATIGALNVNETATATFTISAKEDAADNYLVDFFLETLLVNDEESDVIYEFENSLDGWTSFDAANNEISDPWWHSSEAFFHGKTPNDSHSGSGHLMSETRNKSLIEFTYPIDNYLVSPNKMKITENSTFSFYARANHAYYYPEHFGVAISENGNSSEADFTTIQDWTITQQQGTNWNKYTVDLSDYEGKEIYIAIRHFFTTEEWNSLNNGYGVDALNIDDILFSNVIIDRHHVPSYDDTDENYFNVVVSNPVDLDAPTGLAASNITTESLTLSWDALEKAQSYNVYRDGELKANVTGTTYNDNNLTHNTEYCYRVAGVHNSNVHEQSEPLCVKTAQKDYSVAISSFTPEVIHIDGKTTTSLDIKFVNDGKYPHESRSAITLSSSDEYVTINTATGSMNALNSGDEVDRSFEIVINENVPNNHVIRINANVQYIYSPYTSWDLPISITVKNDPASPKNFTATATENSVTLCWDDVANAIRYNVYRNGEYVGNTASTTYYDGGLNAGTEYSYYATSVGADGESEPSKEVSVTTLEESEGVVLQSFEMGTGIGQEITLTATLFNNSGVDTPEATTATLTCDDNKYVTIVDGTYDLGSVDTGATKDAEFRIILSEETPLNHVLSFKVTTEYEGGGGGVDNKNYTFDKDLQGWTTMTTDDHNWYHSTLQGDHGYNKSYGTGGFVFSESFCNDGNTGFNPNHWIVSPEKIVPSDATSFDFYVCSMSSSQGFADETFGVFVSTTSNTDPNAFTEITRWTLPEAKASLSMALKSIGLYEYEGQEIWVAIRHFGAGDNAALAVDNITIYNVVQSSFVTTTSSFSVTANPSLNTFAGTGLWSNALLWSKGFVPSSTDDVIVAGDATIESGNITVNTLSIEEGSLTMNGGALTVSGLLVNTDADAFVINNGAQVIQNNDKVAATVNMDIVDWDKWQFIASPVKDIEIEGFVPSTGYDLFKYDGTQKDAEWVNYQGHVADFDETFQQGRGYLASYETETTATFKGVLNKKSSFTFSDVKAHDEENYYANFYLLGNPFTFNMDINNLVASGMETGIAVINATGNGYEYRTSGSVKVGEGFFVKTAAATASLSYSEGAKRGDDKVAAINLIATSKAGNDNVIIRLAGADNEGFNKLDNLDRGVAEIYVHNDGNRYGIMSFDENTTEVEVAFHANEMGNYTIAAVAEGDFSSVVLLDRFTGAETNLLVEDYDFTATSRDEHDRFIVKLVNGQQSADNSHFAYVSGEDLILEAEGKVQIIDVMGRMVYSNDVEGDNNRIDVSNFRNGAYVVRLINEEGVKVQKIVVY